MERPLPYDHYRVIRQDKLWLIQELRDEWSPCSLPVASSYRTRREAHSELARAIGAAQRAWAAEDPCIICKRNRAVVQRNQARLCHGCDNLPRAAELREIEEQRQALEPRPRPRNHPGNAPGGAWDHSER